MPICERFYLACPMNELEGILAERAKIVYNFLIPQLSDSLQVVISKHLQTEQLSQSHLNM